MAFDSTKWQTLTGYGAAVNVFAYSDIVTDTLATIKASGFFNEYIDELTIGDVLFVQATDNYQQLRILSVTTNVTVEDYQSGPSAIDGSDIAVLGDASTVGGVPLVTTVETAGGVTATVPVVVVNKIKVLGVKVINKGLGTASDTLTVLNENDAITDAIDISGADKTTKVESTIDDGFSTISALATMNVTETDGGGSDSPAVAVVITYVRVA